MAPRYPKQKGSQHIWWAYVCLFIYIYCNAVFWHLWNPISKGFEHKRLQTLLSLTVLWCVITLIDLILFFLHNSVDLLFVKWGKKKRNYYEECVCSFNTICPVFIRSVKILEHLVFDSVTFGLVLQTTINVDFHNDRFYFKNPHMTCL